jgi:hypothetical protein
MEAEAVAQWVGSRVDDVYGARVGSIDSIYVDAESGEPQWIIVGLGRFSGSQVPVPLHDAIAGSGHVWVPYERDLIRKAPELSAGLPPLSRERELAACDHFAFPQRARRIKDVPAGTPTAMPVGPQTGRIQRSG